jgi:hypothetical protein
MGIGRMPGLRIDFTGAAIIGAISRFFAVVSAWVVERAHRPLVLPGVLTPLALEITPSCRFRNENRLAGAPSAGARSRRALVHRVFMAIADTGSTRVALRAGR